jgi:hypothetical protein
MKKVRVWKIIYAVGCLVYMGWTINAGTNEFDRINSQYSAILDQLSEDRIKNAALEELTAECLKKSKGEIIQGENECLSLPPTVIDARGKEIEERLLRAKERGIVKVVLFYSGFVLIFLLAPPILIYLLIVGIIKLKKSIKFIR